MSKFCVYFVFCVVNGRGYIGKSNDVKKRWSVHCNKSSNCKHLSRAIEKYTKENFRIWVLHSDLNEEQAYNIEKELIEELEMVKSGYNITEGGRGLGSGEKHPSYGRRGENCPNSKLTDHERIEVIDLYISKMFNQREIADMYGVTQAAVSKILKFAGANCNRKHAKSLSDPEKNEICRLYATGNYTYRQLAAIFDVGYVTICMTLKAAGANPDRKPRKSLSLPEKVEIRRLYATGNYTHKQLAAIFDVGHATIYNTIQGL